MSWFVQPETTRIDLEGGQWIVVKKQLNVGEERKAMAALVKEVRADGRMTPDLEMVGKAEVLAYLVDWSLPGKDGKTVKIDTDAKKAAALDQLHPDKFKVIATAIDAHITALKEASEQEKNAESSGETASAAT
jgi:hypothetical protein